jgi:hypothetical protein
MSDELLRKLEERLGPLHARQRLGIEKDHEAQVFGQGLTFFHLENWYSAPVIIRTILKLAGLYWRARRNAESIVVERDDLRFAELPPAFDGFTILHISDLHADMNEVAMGNLIQLVGGMQYDLCVLTGDYRGKTFGPFEAALKWVAKVRAPQGADFRCARQPRHHSNGSDDGSYGYTDFAQRMRNDRTWRSMHLSGRY